MRYVPGDSKANPGDHRARAAQPSASFTITAVACGVEPATENYKVFNNEADDLLQVLDLSQREYGLVADFGNAAGPRKYETLSKLMPRATAIHQWVDIDDDGALDLEDSRHCLNMARDQGFDGPVMLLGGKPYQQYRDTRVVVGGRGRIARGSAVAVFGDAFQGLMVASRSAHIGLRAVGQCCIGQTNWQRATYRCRRQCC